jgi:Transposase IS116/IS110/IS902 family
MAARRPNSHSVRSAAGRTRAQAVRTCGSGPFERSTLSVRLHKTHTPLVGALSVLGGAIGRALLVTAAGRAALETLRQEWGATILAEVGPTAATFPSAGQLASWVGACPGENESAEVNDSHRSPKGNRQMRCLLNQAAHAAVKSKGTIFEILYRRYVPRLGHPQTIGVLAHRLGRLIWKILHQGVRYEERGPALSQKSERHRTARMIRALRSFGYRVELASAQSTVVPA